jgi:4'-phosphopantetheinyl transferase
MNPVQNDPYRIFTFNINGHHIQTFLIHPFTCTEKAPLYHAYLSTDEQERAVKFYFDKDRLMYVLCRGILREILGGITGGAPEKLSFALQNNGKPFLDTAVNPPLYFNVSHSEDAFLIGISRETELGVDIEKIRERKKMDDVISRFADRDVTQRYTSFRGPGKIEYFYRWFTAKEAQGKALGIGIKIFGNSYDPVPRTETVLIDDYCVSIAVPVTEPGL